MRPRNRGRHVSREASRRPRARPGQSFDIQSNHTITGSIPYIRLCVPTRTLPVRAKLVRGMGLSLNKVTSEKEIAMSPTEIAFFSVTLFLALVALLQWKRRRMIAWERVSRGLKGYV